LKKPKGLEGTRVDLQESYVSKSSPMGGEGKKAKIFSFLKFRKQPRGGNNWGGIKVGLTGFLTGKLGWQHSFGSLKKKKGHPPPVGVCEQINDQSLEREKRGSFWDEPPQTETIQPIETTTQTSPREEGWKCLEGPSQT